MPPSVQFALRLRWSELGSFAWAIALASNTLNTPVNAKMWRVTPWLFLGISTNAQGKGLRRVKQKKRLSAEQVRQ